MNDGVMLGAALFRKALILVIGAGLLAAPSMTLPPLPAIAVGAPADLQDRQHDAGICCECCGASDDLHAIGDCLALCVAAYALPGSLRKLTVSQARSEFAKPGDRWTQRYTTPDPDPPNLRVDL
jgi:hypothetical protein